MASGDFDGYSWELSVKVFDSVGSCLAIDGQPLLQEGDQLASGACSGQIEGLQWILTSAAVGPVAYGHAPADAAAVELRHAGQDSFSIVVLHRHPGFDDVVFFVSRLPEGFWPEEAVAIAGDGRELARHPMLVVDPAEGG